MKALVNNTDKLSNDKWLEYRRKGIGGSDVASIAGLNPWRGAYSVYLDKIGELPKQEYTFKMKLGNMMEDIVAALFTEKTGKKVRRSNKIIQHDKYDFMLANVDRLIVGEEAGLECKTTGSFSLKEWLKDVPDYYKLQAYHYMMVTGYKVWYVACLVGNTELIIHKLEWDNEIIEYLTEIEKTFWNENVLARKEPAPDGSNSYDDRLKEKYPESNPNEEIELINFDKRLSRRQEINELIKKLEAEKKTIEQEIKAELKDAETGYSNHYVVTYKTINSSRFDSKKFKKTHPELAENFLTESSYRALKIKEI